MTIIFFIKSKTVNIDKYNIKDIPGSSGRIDVISRCILSAILNNNDFDRQTQIWVFLDRYGTFIFDPESFNYRTFPRNELLFTDYFVDFLRKYRANEDLRVNPLGKIKSSNLNIVDAINHFKKSNYNLFVLHEQGHHFFEILNNFREKKNNVFIIGSQDDEFINSKELLALNIPSISLGNQSYLASSVIRLLKLHLLSL